MAAPSGITWGSAANSKGKIGIYTYQTSTNTSVTTTIEIWIWTKYSVSDSSNTLYFNDNASSATTSRGSVSISTSNDSGSGWNTANQKKLKTYTSTVDRGASAVSRKCAAKLSGVEWVGATMSVTVSYNIPALAKYTVTYDANGGYDVPESQVKHYDKTLTLTTTIPVRDGYIFKGWSTSSSGDVEYLAGGNYTSNETITLYAVWEQSIKLQTIMGRYQNTDGTWGNYSVVYSARHDKGEVCAWSFDGNDEFEPASKSYVVSDEATTEFVDIYRKQYTVYFNANGGVFAKEKVVYYYGSTLTLKTRPIRSGHTFKGWSLQPGGSVTYLDKSSYDTTNTSNATLYAIWTQNSQDIFLYSSSESFASEYVETDNIFDFRTSGSFLSPSFIENSDIIGTFTMDKSFKSEFLHEGDYTKCCLIDSDGNKLTYNGNWLYSFFENN